MGKALRCNPYEKLGCRLIEQSVKEKGITFLCSPLGRFLVEGTSEKVQLKVRQTVFEEKRHRRILTEQSKSAVVYLVDDNFKSIWNMMGGSAVWN